MFVLAKELGVSLINAAKKGNLQEVRKCVDKGVSANFRLPNYSCPAHSTALHAAASGGWLPVVKFLLEKGADLNAVDHTNQTPLHRAVTAGEFTTANFLVDRVPAAQKVEYVTRPDYAGYSAVHLAVLSGNRKLVTAYLDLGIDPNLGANGASTYALLHLVPWIRKERQQVPMARLLLERGADINVRSKTRDTPMHYALNEGSTAFASFLLERGANLRLKNARGLEPMQSQTRIDLGPFEKFLGS